MARIQTKKLIFFAYFLILFLLHELRFFTFSLLFFRTITMDLVFWIMGAVIGFNFLKIDQLIYVYFTHPDYPLSVYVKNLIKLKRFKEAFLFLEQRVEEQRLSFRSALFQVVWAGLAFFILTSTSEYLGKTLVMGIGLSLLLDEWRDNLTQGRNINWLFWQIKRIVSPQEQKWFLWIMTGVFGILSLLLI